MKTSFILKGSPYRGLLLEKTFQREDGGVVLKSEFEPAMSRNPQEIL